MAGPSPSTSKKLNQWTFVGQNDLETGSFEGEPELRISTQFKERLCIPWKKTLVIRLLGRSVSYTYLCSQIRWKWRPKGSMDIMDLNNNSFLVTFSEDQDYLNALTGGPWVILDHYLVVHQWSPSFRTSDKPHKSVVAWVQLPELPVHFYHREVLFALGNLLGRTVKLDYHTEQLERGKFARLAVELDMSKPLATRIRLDGFWQPVLYENLPDICFHCCRIGHLEQSCPYLPGSLLPVGTTTANNVEVSQPPPSSPEPPAGYGPWMQVTRKGRKPNRKVAQNPNPTVAPSSNKGGSSGQPIPTVSAKSAGEPSKGMTVKPGKGKNQQRTETKKGNSVPSPGKVTEDNGKSDLASKKSTVGQEWRAIGPLSISDASKAQSNPPTPLIAAHLNQPGMDDKKKLLPISASLGNPSSPTNSASPQTVDMRENVEPNPSISIRQRTNMKKAARQPLKDVTPGIVNLSVNKRKSSPGTVVK
ncbi:unnamed protein product [Linum tenue]|uniref:CCHC-type domain-containing protein n=1 Tax=Linum tenue TaxID=586396 RepID=A0AAV0I6M9_9ROSI|nr:unnamed protein product [Linum tenue]